MKHNLNESIHPLIDERLWESATIYLENVFHYSKLIKYLWRNHHPARIHKTSAFSLRILYSFFFSFLFFFFHPKTPLFDPRDSSSSSFFFFFFFYAQRAFDDFHSFPSERFRSTFVSRRLALFKQDSDKGNSIPRPFATSLTGITIILLWNFLLRSCNL